MAKQKRLQRSKRQNPYLKKAYGSNTKSKETFDNGKMVVYKYLYEDTGLF